MPRLRKPTFRQLRRYGLPRLGAGDPVTWRTLYPNSSGASTVDDLIGFDRRIQWWQVTNQAVGVTATGNAAAMTRTGTAAVFSDATGQYESLTSGAAAVAGWTNTSAPTQRRHLPNVIWAWKTGPDADDITDIRLWQMLIDNTGDQAVSIPDLAFGFRLNDIEDSDTNFQIFSRNGATSTVSDTGVPAVVNTRYVMRIHVFSTSEIRFYINNSLVGTITNTGAMLTDSTALFGQNRLVRTGAAAATNREARYAQMYLSTY